MKASIIISSYKRSVLLDLGLQSIRRQHDGNEYEILVVNDGVSDDGTKSVCKKWDAYYYFTGHKKKDIHWRSPVVPWNAAVKLSLCDIIILTAPEIWHMDNDTLSTLIAPLENHPGSLCVPNRAKDDNGSFFKLITPFYFDDQLEHVFLAQRDLNIKIPFLMAMRKEHFMTIGGYDEDFQYGQMVEDRDLIERLLAYGCRYFGTDSRCIHLYHDRSQGSESSKFLREKNAKIYSEKHGTIMRNVDREWGVL